MIQLVDIKNIISETLGVEEHQIVADAHFYKDLNAEKIEVGDLLIKIIQKYKLEFNTNSINNIQTVEDLLNLINENIDEV